MDIENKTVTYSNVKFDVDKEFWEEFNQDLDSRVFKVTNKDKLYISKKKEDSKPT